MTNKQLVILLESLGIMRQDLAIALEVHPITIWRWEQGKTPIPKYVERELSRLVEERS